ALIGRAQRATDDLLGDSERELSDLLAKLADHLLALVGNLFAHTGSLCFSLLASLGQNLGRLSLGCLSRTRDNLLALTAGLGDFLFRAHVGGLHFRARRLSCIEALADSLAALGEHVQDRLVQEHPQEDEEYDEIDDLSDQKG